MFCSISILTITSTPCLQAFAPSFFGCSFPLFGSALPFLSLYGWLLFLFFIALVVGHVSSCLRFLSFCHLLAPVIKKFCFKGSIVCTYSWVTFGALLGDMELFHAIEDMDTFGIMLCKKAVHHLAHRSYVTHIAASEDLESHCLLPFSPSQGICLGIYPMLSHAQIIIWLVVSPFLSITLFPYTILNSSW